MNTIRAVAIALRLAIVATLAASGYIHAQLYLGEYRFIHIVGDLFLLQASASFAVAVLILFAAPLLLRAAAAGVALGALAGFTASRTVGVFGFTEHGLQPAPQALLSILTETGTLLLLAAWQAAAMRQRSSAQPQEDVPSRSGPAPQRPFHRPGPRPGQASSTRGDQ
ncbi:hypothetical protein NGB36_01810 [Streptomyces sp. RB6PN25]|uniref:DUF4345 domain-containing protein n=1 Tax=Streptomyces humicola TaxID=2953240 RepID=A0ABT1PQG1_9ACTN|nr:hypothetical protein [Streptomyces humicola]MCQ4079373.1 hypothetical protein [Streptomyces humicola]